MIKATETQVHQKITYWCGHEYTLACSFGAGIDRFHVEQSNAKDMLCPMCEAGVWTGPEASKRIRRRHIDYNLAVD